MRHTIFSLMKSFHSSMPLEMYLYIFILAGHALQGERMADPLAPCLIGKSDLVTFPMPYRDYFLPSPRPTFTSTISFEASIFL